MQLRFTFAILALGAGCIAPPPAVAPSSPVSGPEPDAPSELWAGSSVEKIYERGEVREFEIRQGGESIGRSWGRYAGQQGDGHAFETRIELRVPGRAVIRSEGRLVLDKHGVLIDGYERSDAAELKFRRDGEELELSDGRRGDRVAYSPKTEDTAVMAHSAILHAELMLALRSIQSGENRWRLLSLSGGPPVQWQGRASAASDRILIETNLGELITFAEGRIRSIDVEASDMQIRPVSDPQWPTWEVEGPKRLTYEPPADANFRIDPVELPGRKDEPQLFGEVLLPTMGNGPFPGVVYISSTGQEDRHGFAGPPPVDLGSHAITDGLASAGFAVLRFDERGRGKSDDGPISFTGQVEDARRAFRTLVVHENVDPDRIVIVGAGEGAWRALHVAVGRKKETRGVALLGAPGRRYEEVFFHQAEAMLREIPPSVRDEARSKQRELLEAIKVGGDVPPELRDQADWIREILLVRPERLVGEVTAPMLIAQGGKDFEVDPKVDVAALVAAAKKNKRRHKVKRYPDLDHHFVYEPGESGPSRYLNAGRAVDSTFITDLVAWAKKVAD